MFKGFILGLGLAAGFTVGMVAVGTIAIKTVTAEFIQIAENVQKNVAESEKPQGDLDPTMDDLEIYRECILVNYDGSARDAVKACDVPMTIWQQSPTFKAEWNKLIASDREVRDIIAIYQNARKASK